MRGEEWGKAGGDGQGGFPPRGHVHFTVIRGIFLDFWVSVKFGRFSSSFIGGGAFLW